MQSARVVSLVFGTEDSGLNRAELLACTHVCSIPTSEVMASLNLSHAVAVVLSVIAGDEMMGRPSNKVADEVAAPVEEVEALVSHLRQAMVDAKITKAGNPDRMLAHMKRSLQRADLTVREIAIWRGVLSKFQWKMGRSSQD